LTRFLIISDTHSFKFGDAEPVHGKFTHPLPKCDVLLHCGDLTYRGGLEEYKECIKMLGSIDAELKLVIAGNHDLTLDGQYWASHAKTHEKGQHMEALKMWSGKEARDAGITYLEEGLRTYKLKNGSKFTIYTSPYQPEL
jgi:predicted phosphodiesterase